MGIPSHIANSSAEQVKNLPDAAVLEVCLDDPGWRVTNTRIAATASGLRHDGSRIMSNNVHLAAELLDNRIPVAPDLECGNKHIEAVRRIVVCTPGEKLDHAQALPISISGVLRDDLAKDFSNRSVFNVDLDRYDGFATRWAKLLSTNRDVRVEGKLTDGLHGITREKSRGVVPFPMGGFAMENELAHTLFEPA